MRPMPAKRIIVVGHSALDNIYRIEKFPATPTKVRALERLECGGGAAANAAAAIASLGGEVELWSRTGADEAGRSVRRSLERAGVDVSYVPEQPGVKTPVSTVIVDSKGERLIVSEGDGEMPMSTDRLPIHNIEAAGAVLSDLSWLEGTLAAFREARRRGVTTLLDVDLGSGALIEHILDLTSYAIFSEPGFERFVEGAGLEDRLSKLVSKGVRHAGVTCGARGYHWLSSDGVRGFQEAYPVEAADTTGAGDAFHGAFALGLTWGLDDAGCARIASAVAALKCRRLGARAGLPTAAEVSVFLRERTGRGLPEGVFGAGI
ncbi:MAG: PfkB family carbohydrate kinase [Hyphomicrobium sp.]